MKHLVEYITEKFKITKDINIIDEREVETLIDNIFYYFELVEDKKAEKVVKDWIINNDISKVEFCCSQETFDEIKEDGFIDKQDLKKINTDSSRNEDCQDELSKAKEIYYFNEYLQLWANDKMICAIGTRGTIYAMKI